MTQPPLSIWSSSAVDRACRQAPLRARATLKGKLSRTERPASAGSMRCRHPDAPLLATSGRPRMEPAFAGLKVVETPVAI